MNARRFRPLAAALLALALAGQPFLAHAGIVSTEQMTAQQGTAAERARIESYLDRAEAAGQLQAHGLDAATAKNRVAAAARSTMAALARSATPVLGNPP